jgi:hypothetical protein
LNPTAEPVYLRITSSPDDEPNYCFQNVQRRVHAAGGRIQFGWAIWERQNVYIEAEHHSVYASSDGTPWLDVTPNESPEITSRLFLPDDTAIYDFESPGIRRDNVRTALADDPLIFEFFRLAEERNMLMNSVPSVGKVVLDGEAARRYERNLERMIEIEHYLDMKYTPQNAPCPCGSGKKFKRCHGEPRRVRRQ